VGEGKKEKGSIKLLREGRDEKRKRGANPIPFS